MVIGGGLGRLIEFLERRDLFVGESEVEIETAGLAVPEVPEAIGKILKS